MPEQRPRIMARSRNDPGLGITDSEQRQLMLRLEELARIEGLRDRKVKAKLPTSAQILVDSKADDSRVLKKDGSVVLEGPFTFREMSNDPLDPDEGHATGNSHPGFCLGGHAVFRGPC